MKNSTKVFAVFGIIALLAVSLAAAQMFGNGVFSGEDKEAIKAEREAIKEAIENNDYDTWASIMQERAQRIQDSINEETFQQIRERHAEMEQFRAEMEDLREEYGVGRGMGHGFRGGCPMAEEPSE